MAFVSGGTQRCGFTVSPREVFSLPKHLISSSTWSDGETRNKFLNSRIRTKRSVVDRLYIHKSDLTPAARPNPTTSVGHYLEKDQIWIGFAAATTMLWGMWGALIEIPEKAGFPPPLAYSVWAATMIPPALLALSISNWNLDRDARSVRVGLAAGLLGAGGQLILFEILRLGPAYIVFPIVSLSPVVTVLLSTWLIDEQAGTKGWLGVALALAAIALFSIRGPSSDAPAAGGSFLWLLLTLLVFSAWGIQGYIIKQANSTMRAESIFFYMAAAALLLVPIAVAMTDFSQRINWGLRGAGLAVPIQLLNAVGALCVVYAYRYGRAIIVSPMTSAAAPMVTVVLSLYIYSVDPLDIPLKLVGIVVAITAAFLMAADEARMDA